MAHRKFLVDVFVYGSCCWRLVVVARVALRFHYYVGVVAAGDCSEAYRISPVKRVRVKLVEWYEMGSISDLKLIFDNICEI